MEHAVASRAEWLQARKKLLAEEKAFLKMRDRLSQARRALPWVPVTRSYVFEGPEGQSELSDLFGPCSQLAVYHFMFGPDWEAGCPSCSFVVNHFDGMIPYLSQRGVSLTVVSRAPYPKLAAFKKRMGWHFDWRSSVGSEFNYDFGVSFTPEQIERGDGVYNFQPGPAMGELPGLSVFAKDGDGQIFHTYSTYARGLDPLIGAYQILDLVPKGRDEDALDYPMAWVRLKDEFDKP